jgi:hypothetical protein
MKKVIGDATLYLADCRDILGELPKVDAPALASHAAGVRVQRSSRP